ncbi:MAG TPA: glycosyltransferase [Nitrospira sp.]|nr:glycosyltransferase [Nitrospira sp.]
MNPSISLDITRFLHNCLQTVQPASAVSTLHNKLRVLHCIGGLIPGGAERQLCNFVVGASRRGLDVRVLTLRESVGEDAHYVDLLHRAGIHPFIAGAEFNSSFSRKLQALPGTLEFLNQLPEFFRPSTVDVFGELLVDPPDIVHAWLDHNNVWAGLAAVLAGVPAIILSTRNVNPTHFPYLAHPLFQPWYQLLATSPRVHFINNSWAGAKDYAQWLALPLDRFHVVHNGVDFSTVTRAPESEVLSFKQDLQIPPGAPIVAGVFRLSEEKQPLVFFEVVKRAMQKVHNLHAVIAGVGPCETELRDAIAHARLSDRIRLLGRRKDIPVVMSAATLCLLTSRQEGTPNVLLEAQWLGCPVVSTKAGGAVDAVSHGKTGLLLEVGDIEGLTEAVVSLLHDDQQRQRLAAEGPGFIKSHFGVDRMVEETLAVYEHALSCANGALTSDESTASRNGWNNVF